MQSTSHRGDLTLPLLMHGWLSQHTGPTPAATSGEVAPVLVTHLQGPDLLLREVVRGGALCAESPQVGHGDVDHVLDELAVLPGAQGQLALQPIASRLLV